MACAQLLGDRDKLMINSRNGVWFRSLIARYCLSDSQHPQSAPSPPGFSVSISGAQALFPESEPSTPGKVGVRGPGPPRNWVGLNGQQR